MPANSTVRRGLDSDPEWYKTAIIYQLHVRAFYDSNDDGIGDFRGLTQKLDYLQDLGVTALWLLPFYPSPLKDDGYDIADYYSVHPMYGTLTDFKVFLREAHRRGLRVITELVVNHTSDQHQWFQRARRAKPGSRWHNFYVWSDTAEEYAEARIIFKDFEPSNWTWDPVAKAHYWHRFYAHQPDLNFDHPAVHRELLRVLDFWYDLGVDGLRLDAVPYLYEREGTNCENLPETHAFLRKLRRHVDSRYSDRMLLAEANQWPEDAVAYFGAGEGDECHMAFHFPVMPRLFMAARMEDRTPIIDIVEQTPPIPSTSQWAVFLRNHDELTLEMVTDEERDYMYRVYAQDTKARINLGIRRRLAPLLNNNRRTIELLNALLLSLPGTPVIYYGDEIGLGDNVFLGDRNGVRTPMQWSSDKNAGFSRANPHSLYLPVLSDPEYSYAATNVETQQQNTGSLLWWTKRLLALRKRWQAFGLGSITFLHPENRKVLAFLRRHEDQCVLVVCNLSRFVQPVDLDLGEFQQHVPVELFGHTPFPPITEDPYFLTLGPHAFYWFSLVPQFGGVSDVAVPEMPVTEWRTLKVNKSWQELFEDRLRPSLERVLDTYIRPRRWFGGKARKIKGVEVGEWIRVPLEGSAAVIVLLDIEYVNGDPERYALPLCYEEGESVETRLRETPHLVLARLKTGEENVDGVLLDATGSHAFNEAMLAALSGRRSFKGAEGELKTTSRPWLRRLKKDTQSNLEPTLGRAEQSNSSVVFGDRLILKYFRRVESGINPDIEIGQFLADRNFPHAPAIAGALTYERVGKDKQTAHLGMLMEYLPNSQDGWTFTLDTLKRYFDRIEAIPQEATRLSPTVEGSVLDWETLEADEGVFECLGTYVRAARLLGERTADLHRALASEREDKDFRPEPINPFYQRGLYQSMRNQAVANLDLLRRRSGSLPTEIRESAQRLLDQEKTLLRRYRTVADARLTGMRTRIHGDYHLGQVLYTGKDFSIIDFEGEPARPISERRLKYSPLRDVAGMVRSFHYAAQSLLYQQRDQGLMPEERFKIAAPWARFWSHWVGVLYLKAYFAQTAGVDFLPRSAAEVRVLLEANLMHKAVYELGYELNNRPTWLPIPLQGIEELLNPPTI